MKKVIDCGMMLLLAAWVLAMAWFLSGCTTKTRHLDISGAYVAQSGAIAIGSVEVQSAPEGVESAMVSYEDSAAWFSDVKEHRIRILLTGTNSTASADCIVSNICKAFVRAAPVVTGTITNMVPASAKPCKCNPCNCDPCKCRAREPEDKSEEPPPQELPSI